MKLTEFTFSHHLTTLLQLVKLGALAPVDGTLEQLKSAKFDVFGTVFLVLQIFLIIIYGITATYDSAPTQNADGVYDTSLDNRVEYYYFYYSDITFMVFIGLGFLTTFLRKYAYSSIGFTFFIATFVFQWSLLVVAFFDRAYDEVWGRLEINMVNLIQGMYGAFTCLITFGMTMGNVTPTQILILTLFEVPFYGLNRYICLDRLGGLDLGGSMVIHMFGAYFGLGAAWVLADHGHSKKGKHKNTEASYSNDLFSMIGTLFLWVLWPSFNAALATEVSNSALFCIFSHYVHHVPLKPYSFLPSHFNQIAGSPLSCYWKHHSCYVQLYYPQFHRLPHPPWR
jgi:hypothetical protein